MVRRGVLHAKALKSYLQSEVVPEEVEIEAAVADDDGGEVGDADYCHWDHRTFAVLREDAGVNHGGDAAASVEVAAGDDVAEVAVAASEAQTSFVAAGQKDGGMLPAPWAEAERGQMAHMVVHILL
jgi:hypothetical protein